MRDWSREAEKSVAEIETGNPLPISWHLTFLVVKALLAIAQELYFIRMAMERGTRR